MSIIYATSPKHCAAKQTHRFKSVNKKLLLSLISSLLLSLLFLFLILRPSKPQFRLREAALYDLTLSSPAALPRLLNSTIQATLVSNNPNAHVGVYYDRLRAYAAYRGQQISTAEAALPGFYQGGGDSNLLSAWLEGVGMPVGLALGDEVVRDRMNGKMVVAVRMDGEMRWKVGSWVSGRHRFHVDCLAVIAYGAPGGGAGGMLGSPEGAECSTSTNV